LWGGAPRTRIFFFLMLRAGKRLFTIVDSRTAAKDALNLLPFADAEVSGVQTHKNSLSLQNSMESVPCVCLNNNRLCMAQVAKSQILKIFF
jgi:hypothetical protein